MRDFDVQMTSFLTVFFEDAFTIGSKKGAVLDRNKFDAMLTQFYKDRGWDSETTAPGKIKLKELGLDSIQSVETIN